MSLPRVVRARLDSLLSQRPVLVAIAGSNGAGKSTFYEARLAQSGLLFVNADVIGKELEVDPYAAAELADQLRRALVRQRESFIFETVFSDPHGAKLSFLTEAAASGFTVVLIFIGISSTERSDERVAMRVSQGGHDVPKNKLRARFPRTLANLAAALGTVPYIFIYDNDDPLVPFRLVSVQEHGKNVWRSAQVPSWMPSSHGIKAKPPGV